MFIQVTVTKFVFMTHLFRKTTAVPVLCLCDSVLSAEPILGLGLEEVFLLLAGNDFFSPCADHIVPKKT